MSDIPRYEMRYPISLSGEGPIYGPSLHPEGGWVTYADHVALEDAFQRGLEQRFNELAVWIPPAVRNQVIEAIKGAASEAV